MTYDSAISAIADPTRRAVLEALRAGPKSVASLADQLPVSRPAVSQHLKVLAQAGLVTVTPVGTRRMYQIAPDAVAELRAYLDGLWSDALQVYADAAHIQAKKGPLT